MTYVILIILGFVCFGCGALPREYELDETSFDASTTTKIQQECGLTLPAGTKGLRFHYIPPVDPIVFAKLAIPMDGLKGVETWLEGLTFSGNAFPKQFGNSRCKWWLAGPHTVIISKEAFVNGYYIDAHLVEENGQKVLYLKYFSI